MRFVQTSRLPSVRVSAKAMGDSQTWPSPLPGHWLPASESKTAFVGSNFSKITSFIKADFDKWIKTLSFYLIYI